MRAHDYFGPRCEALERALRELAKRRMVRNMHRFYFASAGALGFLGVALGAFGAHGLTQRLASLTDGAQRLDWWKTAALYHLVHALALGLAAGLLGETRAGRFACTSFCVGIALFSGSLYVMTLTGTRWLGAITPLGGLAFLAGWGALTVAAWSAG